jgi:hypothetical protein
MAVFVQAPPTVAVTQAAREGLGTNATIKAAQNKTAVLRAWKRPEYLVFMGVTETNLTGTGWGTCIRFEKGHFGKKKL